jgi:hypothetical protein
MQENVEDLSEATACRSKFVYQVQGKQDSDTRVQQTQETSLGVKV